MRFRLIDHGRRGRPTQADNVTPGPRMEMQIDGRSSGAGGNKDRSDR